MKIYTKTGDGGQTSLLGGKRVGKQCIEMQVIGEIDELNASLGVVLSFMDQMQDARLNSLNDFIKTIQRDLFQAGAEIAALQGPLQDVIKKTNEHRVSEMEAFIDEFWNQLPELKNFIVPGGVIAAAEIHKARTVCRRVERQLVAFALHSPVRSELRMYFNRLSDFLFAAARYVNFCAGAKEELVV